MHILVRPSTLEISSSCSKSIKREMTYSKSIKRENEGDGVEERSCDRLCQGMG